jgi:hypothetical protein
MTKAEAGLIGARRRWGEPRVVRLDDLPPEGRRLVLALVSAAKEAPAPPKADALEVSRVSDATTAGRS